MVNVETINVLLNAGADPSIGPNGEACIHHVISKGYDKEALQALIDHGADVNTKDKDNVTALMRACNYRMLHAVNDLLDAGADPNAANVNLSTCLHYAIYSDCSKELLQALVDRVTDVNAVNKDNVTALMLACRKRRTDAINVLLKANSDPNIVNTYGETCLHLAVRGFCSKKMIQTIIDHGADVNATNKNNMTALVIACVMGNKDAIRVLLNAGADPNIADVDGNTWLHGAVRGECTKVVLEAIIGKGADVNTTNKDGATPLMIACGKGNKDDIKLLLHAGADPNITDDNGNTWLHEAVRGECSEEVLQTIIDHGANTNATSEENITALMVACKTGNVNIINALLNAGANTNVNGDTCLIYAIANAGNKNVIQVLIDCGVDVNAANKDSITALMIACWMGNIDIIYFLLKAGAYTNITDVNGATCLTYAIDGHCSEYMPQTIVNRGAVMNATKKCQDFVLTTSCYKRTEDAINIMLNAGADPNITDDCGHTCLHAAVIGRCNTGILQVIIDHMVDMNATTYESKSALSLACRIGNVDAMNVLLNAGADPNITDADGNTPLHHAIEGSCSKQTLEVIIGHGADVNTTNKNGITAFMLACKKRNTDAMKMFQNTRADPNIADADGNTLLHHACERGCSKKVLQALLPNTKNKKKESKKNQADLISNVVRIPQYDSDSDYEYKYDCDSDDNYRLGSEAMNADVNATNKTNVTALMLACMKGNTDAISVLLSAGANPHIADADGNTSLHHAIEGSCNRGSLKALIAHMRNIHDADFIRHHRKEMYEAKTPGVDATNKRNVTALMLACKKGNTDAISVVLSAGANPHIADADGKHFTPPCCSGKL